MTTRAADIKIESDEGGWYLTVEDVEGNRYDFLLPDPKPLYVEARLKIEPWLREQKVSRQQRAALRRAVKPYDQEEAYDLSDPKSPGYHDRMSAIWDNRDKTDLRHEGGER